MTETSKENSETKQRKKMPWKSIGILFSTIAIIVLLYAFYAANAFYLKSFSHTASVQDNYAQLQKNVDDLTQQLSKLSETINSQNQVINALRQTQSGYNREEWRIVEAEFLVNMANDKLQLAGDVAQAIVLLQSADREISDINDAHMLSLRKALATDIAALQTVPQVDVSGIYMRLAAINEQITKLPLPNKPASQTQDVQAAQVNESLPWWKRGLQESWHALKQIVVIRYNKTGSLPLVMPEQQDFLYQNIHASIEKAMWALLNKQPDIYRTSLTQATTWIREFFVPDSPVTQGVLTNLAQLQTIDVHPPIPKLAESLQAFHEYFIQTNNQPAAASQ